MPALRIVDDEQWAAVQARYATVQKKWKTAEPGKGVRQFVRPKYLFTGMTRCGECGAGFVVYYRDRLGCFGTRERGTCTNTLTIPRQEVEARVLTALQEKLPRKDFFDEFCREFAKETNRLRMEQRASLNGAKRELERIEARRKKLVQSIMDGVPAAVVKDELIANAIANPTWKPSSPLATSRRHCCTRACRHLRMQGGGTRVGAPARRHAPRSVRDAPWPD